MKIKVIDFWASWCKPCMSFAPKFKEIEEKYKNQVEFESINVDTNVDILKEYNVRNIPTVLIVESGEVIERLTGIENVTNLEQEILKRI